MKLRNLLKKCFLRINNIFFWNLLHIYVYREIFTYCLAPSIELVLMIMISMRNEKRCNRFVHEGVATILVLIELVYHISCRYFTWRTSDLMIRYMKKTRKGIYLQEIFRNSPLSAKYFLSDHIGCTNTLVIWSICNYYI